MLAITSPRTLLAIEARKVTREEWLENAVEALRPLFREVTGRELPPVRVSAGFPGGGSARKRVGECWATFTATDKISNIFISPVLDDEVEVLATLAHELVHALDNCKSGHKGAFSKIAKAIGLTGKMTATVAGDELRELLVEIAAELGDYPHGKVTLGSSIKKQSTRMLKVECPSGSGYLVRMTRTWLDTFGAPICPCCEERMLEA